jgi:hypothetical protein
VSKQLLCLTIDTDPDGFSSATVDRAALKWDGFENLPKMLERIEATAFDLGVEIPVTWFLRSDGQLERAYGHALYLLQRYEEFWETIRHRGDELGWHPHLYTEDDDGATILIKDPEQACDELERLSSIHDTEGFHPVAFRNGEGWHTTETLATIERLRIEVDSTAIPGRTGGANHPMEWTGAPNQPYFPDAVDPRRAGPRRGVLEIPINTWRLRTPYDSAPKLRYINPAVHVRLFESALETWVSEASGHSDALSVWVLILHPDEVLPQQEDALYAWSVETACRNIAAFLAAAQGVSDTAEFTTLASAAEAWRHFPHHANSDTR